MNKNITQKRLKELLHYNPDTGVFVCVNGRKKLRKGDISGYLNRLGYVQIGINGKIYLAHRLAWLYEHGYLPENNIDHVNRNRSDNRISNLREVSQQCNMRNCGNYKHNTSGVKGVHWNKNQNKWQTSICVNGIMKHLGVYKSFDNAVCARLAGEECLNWDGCDSSSPAFKYVQKIILKK